MLQELSHMDRITQLQDEIQQVRSHSSLRGTSSVLMWWDCIGTAPNDHVKQHRVPDLARKLPAGQSRRADHEVAPAREVRHS